MHLGDIISGQWASTGEIVMNLFISPEQRAGLFRLLQLQLHFLDELVIFTIFFKNLRVGYTVSLHYLISKILRYFIAQPLNFKAIRHTRWCAIFKCELVYYSWNIIFISGAHSGYQLLTLHNHVSYLENKVQLPTSLPTAIAFPYFYQLDQAYKTITDAVVGRVSEV